MARYHLGSERPDLQVTVVAGTAGAQAARSALAAASIGMILISPTAFTESLHSEAGETPALFDLSGLALSNAAELIARGAVRARSGAAIMVVCESTQLDLLGPLLGTGATVICDPDAEELNTAVREVFCCGNLRFPRDAPPARSSISVLDSATVALQKACCMNTSSQTVTVEDVPTPFWLDILSDLLTDLAIARQSDAPEAVGVATLLEQTADALLAVPTSEALQAAVRQCADHMGTGSAEAAAIERELAARLARRALQ